MITLTNLESLWQTYFQDPELIKGLDAWTIVYMAKDKQRFLVSLANPFEEKYEDIFVENISEEDIVTFVQLYKQRFTEQLELRFGLFKPGIDKVLTEYPDWNTFYETWLNSDPKLVQLNFPLLFDFPTQDEYSAMHLKDANFAGYRRLLVVMYQYRKAKFYKIFIKDVDDAGFEQIKQQIISLFTQSIPELMINNPLGK